MHLRQTIILITMLLGSTIAAHAQFMQTGNITGGVPGSEKTGSSVNPESSVEADSTSLFSIRDYVRGLAHKDTLKAYPLMIGSAFVPGGAQVYNRQYAKLPFIYAGIGSTLYFGLKYNNQYKQTGEQWCKTAGTAFLCGAAALYWGTLLDGIVNFESDKEYDSDRATLYSILLPGLGQAYNGDYWKIPVWYAGFVACGYFWHFNDIQYQRFKYVNKIANDKQAGYVGHISTDQAVYYRDLYRRYRDYSIVATVVVYAIQAIDANVFAFMHDFETSDDLSFRVTPAVIPDISPLQTNYASNNSTLGLQMQLKF